MHRNLLKNLKSSILNGEVVYGCWLNLGCSLAAEIVATAGFDWVLVDLEHGVGTENDTLYQIQAVAHTPAEVIVRVESHDRQRAHRVLDLGAAGVMFPRVDSADEAKTAIEAMRYPPQGVRGIAQMTRAAAFGNNMKEYLATANDELLGIVQIETVDSVKNVDSIAAVNGADVLFVGPSDLTQSMGIFGQFENPRYLDALTAISDSAKKHNKCAGILCTPNNIPKYKSMGFRFFASNSDIGILNTGAREILAAMKNE
jgi:2-keto-3-deoxy-L-rhamnonate aldolase RhmA